MAETDPGTFRLLGQRTPAEDRAWSILEGRGLVTSEEVPELLDDADDRAAFERLVERRLVFRSPLSGRVHALSRLVKHLM